VAQRLNIEELKDTARSLRREILKVIAKAGSGHPGGSLSSVEIILTLYGTKLRFDPKQPESPDRDVFIISKGHGTLTAYAVLAEFGFFPKEELQHFRELDCRLQGHAHRSVPGIEASTGSLGQGLSIANGFALAAKLDGSDRRTYCLLGDGESQEGQVWEAAMTAAHRNLNNVCAIVDANGVQQNGPVSTIKDLEPLADKWQSFGWNALDIDGHDVEALIKAYDAAEKETSKPTVIIARTKKGKGISFMEGNHKWHGKAPKPDELEAALAELK